MNKFPYNMRSREALVELIRQTEDLTLSDDLVTFEDIVYSPTQQEPGRTFIEMIDLRVNHKYWYAYRRLELDKALPLNYVITLTQRPTPAAIVNEINRSLGMNFGPDDTSFSNTILTTENTPFVYRMVAFAGSYAYCGAVNILVNQAIAESDIREEEDGTIRLEEDGIIRRKE